MICEYSVDKNGEYIKACKTDEEGNITNELDPIIVFQQVSVEHTTDYEIDEKGKMSYITPEGYIYLKGTSLKSLSETYISDYTKRFGVFISVG
jgi:hypothetical protein